MRFIRAIPSSKENAPENIRAEISPTLNPAVTVVRASDSFSHESGNPYSKVSIYKQTNKQLGLLTCHTRAESERGSLTRSGIKHIKLSAATVL